TVGADTAMDSPGYWVRQVRATVRYADAIDTVRGEGVTRILEVGPDAILTPLTEGAVPSTRREQSETETLIAAVAQLHTTGQHVDWAAVLPKANVVDLPTYPFQHRRYWMNAPSTGDDPAAVGLTATDHPLVGAAIAAPDSDAVTLTGRLSRDRQSWLGDHTLLDTVVFPGAGLVELALVAARHAGCGVVRELTAEAPLVPPTDGGLSLRVVVAAPDEDGVRALTIHSRGDDPEQPWTRHATGVLADDPVAPPAGLVAWPPADAEPIDLDAAYARLLERGHRYGPAFHCLRAAWRRGDELLAEAETGDDGFVVHPAVLEAAVQLDLVTHPGDEPMLPTAWTGVAAYERAGSAVRVRIAPAETGGSTVTLTGADQRPILSVASMVAQPAAERLAAHGGHGTLLRLEWIARPTAEPAEGIDLYHCPESSDFREVLAAVGARLAVDNSRLAIVTRDAAVGNLAHAPVWGLIRALRAEHPGRLVLVDTDGSPEAERLLPAALGTGEAEVAVRGGAVLVPRLVRADAPGPRPDLAGGTVLVTGGTAGAGAQLARHLVAAYGVEHLVVTGETGRDALAQLLAAIPAEHPLTAVVHADGTAETAWHLHELTDGLDLAAFVLLSSIAATVPGMGRGDAATAAFLDALAVRRAAAGQPARSIAFGPWEGATPVEHGERPARFGLPALSVHDGLALFDAAMRTTAPAVTAVRLDQLALWAHPRELPPVLRALIRGPARRLVHHDTAAELRRQLAGLDAGERIRALLDLVRNSVAAVLSHASPDAVEPDRAFKELGFDSLAAMELRKRLNEATGLTLPATLIFDYPTARIVAEHLDAGIAPAPEEATRPALDGLDRLEAALAGLRPSGSEHRAVEARLEAVLRRWRDAHGDASPDGPTPNYGGATDDELFDVLDSELTIG
ncbi:type I polyketide synthase, partial [Rhizomonospora bruguierae]|uniref:type I polyketide synthase n=1 Tax=Rhizomonospora bruguierae TaxID=1581705 RepID=UPI0024BDD316